MIFSHTFPFFLSHTQLSVDSITTFVKIHAPFDVLAQTAEFMNLKLPMKRYDIPADFQEQVNEKFRKLNCFELEDEVINEIEEREDFFTAPFNRARVDEYVISLCFLLLVGT